MSGQGACAHIEAVDSIKQAKKTRLRRVRENRRAVGSTCGPARNAAARTAANNSPNKHATKHAKATSHPVIASAEPGERWLYCYPDDAFAEY